VLADEIADLRSAGGDAPCADYLIVTTGQHWRRTLVTPSAARSPIRKIGDAHREKHRRSRCRLRLQGPGIKGAADVAATELVARALKLRDAQQYELPQGIDFIFVSDDGDLLAIPRLTRMEVL
jgi:alpha-D-ribose 1-methylphosphonate 5-triphosphate synthase subunit PhnH